MGIDPKRIRAKAEEARKAADPDLARVQKPAGAGKKRLPGVLKHLRKVRNFVARMQAGEDVDKLWAQMARDLRELNRAARKAAVDVDRSYPGFASDPRNPEAKAAAREIAGMLSRDRALATKLDHPEWADLGDKVNPTSFPHIVVIRGRWLVTAGDGTAREYPGEAEATEALKRLLDEAGDAEAGRMGRWSKLVAAIEWFL